MRRSTLSLQNFGNAATQAARQHQQASSSIERSLQREIALLQAGERGSRVYYESLACQRGENISRLNPLWNQLDGLRSSGNNTIGGISQGQYNAAMRTLPAQVTDIVIRLAGGQNPFLIALQ